MVIDKSRNLMVSLIKAQYALRELKDSSQKLEDTLNLATQDITEAVKELNQIIIDLSKDAIVEITDREIRIEEKYTEML